MAHASAAATDANQIPVVDLAPLRDGSDRGRVADAIHAACRETGFLYVRNHGICQSLIEACRREAMAFFRQPTPVKDRIAISPQHRGFLGVGAARMSDDAQPDLKESFVWGGEGVAPQNQFNGPNQWPDAPAGLRSLAVDYFDAAHGVARDLLTAFALGMGLDEDSFLAGSDRPISRASFVYYPPQPAQMGDTRFGVAPHTDFGVLTVLCQDDVGGLQIEGLDGRWIMAPPIEGTLVVNVGDLLERWTNGYFRSTPHRVVNASGKERLSIVLAYDPATDTMIDPALAQTVTGPPTSQAITCGDYLTWRFKKAFSYKD